MPIPKTRFRRHHKTQESKRPTLDDAARLLAGIHHSTTGRTECPRCDGGLSTVVGTRDHESIWLLRCATCAYSAVVSLPPDTIDATNADEGFGVSTEKELATVERSQPSIGPEDDDESHG